MRWFTALKNSKNSEENRLTTNESSRHKAVRSAADLAWKKYNKTFNDLARYDRGEKISNSVLHTK